MERKNVNEAVRSILAGPDPLTSGRLASELGVTRQAAHKWLSRLVSGAELERIGAGRGTSYRRPQRPFVSGVWPREGLAEDKLWRMFEPDVTRHVRRENVISVLHFGFTEMVNNAIDHSAAQIVAARFLDAGTDITFEVEDDGVGIFEHVMSSRGLRTPFEAIAELQKGKVTTMPAAHTGQGIFFASKMADRMTLESGITRWTIDTARNDQAISIAPRRKGTLVTFEIGKSSPRTTKQVFDAYTNEDLEFSRTRTSIKLFREGAEIISRSEAKRLLDGLEKFDDVELDFGNVTGIGQGFADEVFRVWQRSHPRTRLTVTNANRAVQFVIDRARRETSGSDPVPHATDVGAAQSTPTTTTIRVWGRGAPTSSDAAPSRATRQADQG